MDAFLLRSKSEIILNSEENLSLSVATLDKQVGVVSFPPCSYEARAFGVHSAMSSKEAYERCPQAVFISGNYEKYKTVGLQIRAIFKRYTDLIEPMSIDKAYLDVTKINSVSSQRSKLLVSFKGYLAGTTPDCFRRRLLQQILS